MPPAASSLWDRHGRRIRQLAMLGLRLGNAGAKFALAIYMARYLGLAEVGVYGLLVGAATAVPAIFGFGLNDWTSRHVVGMAHAAAVPVALTRFSLTAAVEAALQAVAWTAVALFGPPLSLATAVLIGAILLLEHLAVDDYALEIGRERPTFANLQLFLRAGLWPPVVIVWGLIDPAARTLEVVLAGWLVGLCVMWAVVIGRALAGGAGRHVGIDRPYLKAALGGGIPFWLSDIGAVGNLYLDRFVVSFFLGMQATGVYTFFWSFANVVHTLAVNGIIQPQVPRLIAAERTGDPARFAEERARLTRESRIWAVVLVVAVGGCMPVLLPWLGRPLLQDNLAVFAVIMAATLARIASDSFGFLLFALHRDRMIAVTALAGVAATALLGVALIPLFGLMGAAGAYLVVGLALALSRRHVLAGSVGPSAGKA